MTHLLANQKLILTQSFQSLEQLFSRNYNLASPFSLGPLCGLKTLACLIRRASNNQPYSALLGPKKKSDIA
jgi:hypothetical protein